ncbi:hypothetical protein AB0D34_34780 [Streptomyces sp. NPDC048420]
MATRSVGEESGIGFGLALAVFFDVFMVRMATAPDGQQGQGCPVG